MQPRYGFTLKRKPTSGLSLVARMPFVVSSQTCTWARGWSSSRYSSAVGAKGFGGFDQARGFTRPMLDLNGCSGQAAPGPLAAQDSWPRTSLTWTPGPGAPDTSSESSLSPCDVRAPATPRPTRAALPGPLNWQLRLQRSGESTAGCSTAVVSPEASDSTWAS